MNFIENHRAFITSLSPVHIGCGYDFEPVSYVVRGGCLYAFRHSSLPMSSDLAEDLKQASQQAVDRDSYKRWSRVFNRHADLCMKHSVAKVPVCASVSEAYEAICNPPPSYDRQQQKKPGGYKYIERTSFIPSVDGDIVYVPGSSLKGAFHTALLDSRKKGHYPRDVNTADKKGLSALDELLLGGSMNNSPMRFLKVGDLMPQGAGAVKTWVRNATRVSKNPEKNKKIKIPSVFEVITPGQYRLGEGEISIQADLKGGQLRQKNSLNTFMRLAHIYSLAVFNEQKAHWMRWQGMKEWVSMVESLLSSLKERIDLGEVALIRIGKNEGADSLTLRSGYASIVNRQAKDFRARFMRSATTLWQCDTGTALWPFGWALLEIDPDGDSADLRDWCQQLQDRLPITAASIESSEPAVERRDNYSRMPQRNFGKTGSGSGRFRGSGSGRSWSAGPKPQNSPFAQLAGLQSRSSGSQGGKKK